MIRVRLQKGSVGMDGKKLLAMMDRGATPQEILAEMERQEREWMSELPFDTEGDYDDENNIPF
ncbi:MAG: hypothetical protein EOM02_07350 [Synergistales bacterium]|nr:hypothetical protein [Synergistales bacterium]